MSNFENTSNGLPVAPVWLRAKQICGPILPISRSTWWEWAKTGKVPRGVKISSRVTVWRLEDVMAVVENCNGGDEYGE